MNLFGESPGGGVFGETSNPGSIGNPPGGNYSDPPGGNIFGETPAGNIFGDTHNPTFISDPPIGN